MAMLDGSASMLGGNAAASAAARVVFKYRWADKRKLYGGTNDISSW
jgi:hypothetical protein